MKTQAVIQGLCSGLWRPGNRRGGISIELLEDLCSIHPEGRCGSQGHCFHLSLPVEDPRVTAILALLERAGMRPWPGHGERTDEEYTYKLRRVYEDDDFEACDYLELFGGYDPDFGVPGNERLGDRTVTAIDEPGPADICMIAPGSHTHVANQRTRDVLESAQFSGLYFLPVEKSYNSVDHDLYDEDDTWWELESDLELPPVAPSVTLVHRDKSPFTGDLSKGCGRQEGMYTNAELHYRRSDLQKFGPFDAARTHEHFVARGPSPRCRALVVSQKFYQVCRQYNIRTRFIPVRIDDE